MEIDEEEFAEYRRYFLLDKIKRAKCEQKDFDVIYLSDLRPKRVNAIKVMVNKAARKNKAKELVLKKASKELLCKFKTQEDELFIRNPCVFNKKPYIPLS